MTRRFLPHRLSGSQGFAAFAAFLLLGMRHTLAQEVAKPEAATPAPARLAPPTRAAALVLAETEKLVRAPETSELMALAAELEARGHADAAKRVLATMTTKADDYDRLSRRLISLGLFAAADTLLRAWERSTPRDSRIHFWRGTLHHAQGEFELAQRAFRMLLADPAMRKQPLVELQMALLTMRLAGRLPGTDANPWQVRFVGPEGNYAPGSLRAEEARKIPAGTVDAFGELLTLIPTQGNLWALYGELINATGDVASAYACFQRAEALRYTPRVLLEHRQLVKQAVDTANREATAQAMAAMAPATRSGDDPSAANPATDDSLRSKFRWVVGIGVGFGALILGLQIREWLKGWHRQQR